MLVTFSRPAELITAIVSEQVNFPAHADAGIFCFNVERYLMTAWRCYGNRIVFARSCAHQCPRSEGAQDRASFSGEGAAVISDPA
jgi:hypothetical protein